MQTLLSVSSGQLLAKNDRIGMDLVSVQMTSKAWWEHFLPQFTILLCKMVHGCFSCSAPYEGSEQWLGLFYCTLLCSSISIALKQFIEQPCYLSFCPNRHTLGPDLTSELGEYAIEQLVEEERWKTDMESRCYRVRYKKGEEKLTPRSLPVLEREGRKL